MTHQTPDIVWPDGYDRAQKAVARAEARLTAATEKFNAIRRQARIRCAQCSSEHAISTQVYIQTHWYTPPHGCTGGDYWNLGEANWRCPSCGFNNRFHGKTDRSWGKDFERPEIVAVRGYFSTIRECYCERERGRVCDACRKHDGGRAA